MYVIQVCSRSGQLRNSVDPRISKLKFDSADEADLVCLGLNIRDIVSWRNRYVVLDLPVQDPIEGGC